MVYQKLPNTKGVKIGETEEHNEIRHIENKENGKLYRERDKIIHNLQTRPKRKRRGYPILEGNKRSLKIVTREKERHFINVKGVNPPGIQNSYKNTCTSQWSPQIN